MLTLFEKDKESTTRIFKQAVDIGVRFKLQKQVTKKHITRSSGKSLFGSLPYSGQNIRSILSEFEDSILPYCTNFSSERFMGFPDAGNSTAAITGSLLKEFCQQNLINQSFCAPSATYIEIAVIRWLREIVGYANGTVNSIWDVGGIITPGGTVSNTIGMLMAREHKFPNTIERGVTYPKRCFVVVPKGIGHYSVKSGAMWVGCGNHLIEIKTNNFRYDLVDLERKLKQYSGRIMTVVAYAGDSRTMTVDNFRKISRLVKKIDRSIWLHADACHGFSLGMSSQLKHNLNGIETFDSITLDPHKVMLIPYTLSALLVKKPSNMKIITSLSDLIMQEDFAFGQITPFLGSRAWESLKLWFMMKHFGKKGLDALITKRHETAKYLESKLRNDKDFIVLNRVQINSVLFMYRRRLAVEDIKTLNGINKAIHDVILLEGKYHLHQFSIPDSGVIQKDAILYPLRFMSGNPNISKKDIDKMVEYVRSVGMSVQDKRYGQ